MESFCSISLSSKKKSAAHDNTEDCVHCKSMCCMAGLSYSAVLTEKERGEMSKALEADSALKSAAGESDFCYYDEKIGAYKMRKFADNRCVFWNPRTFGCRAYESRPLDCRIFPLEYRWFRWIFSPQCPSKNFSKKALLKQLDAYSPAEVRHLKLLHIRTPESTKDRLWIWALKVLPITACYAIYEKIRAR